MYTLVQRAGDRIFRRCDDRPREHLEWTCELPTKRICQ